MENENKVIKLINGDLIIGKAAKGENDYIIMENPYTVKDLGKGPCVMPYEYDLLLEPMKFISFSSFNMMWLKNLSDFPQVNDQYTQATTGLVI